jgi:phospholipase/carboxylesterase
MQTKKTLAELTCHMVMPDEAEKAVILLHGYGANGLDLLSLSQEWSPHLPNTAFIAPDAPHLCEMGGGGFQWFSLRDYSQDVMKRLINEQWQVVDNLIKAIIKKYSIKAENIILSGFSQGCMMALQTAFSTEMKVAGVLGYSGMLVDADILEATVHKDLPVCLYHGDEDSVIPVQAYHQTVQNLKTAGISVRGQNIAGLPHGIDPIGLKGGLGFIQGILKN